MSYKSRNTLILATFVTLILVFSGYQILWSYPSEISSADKRIKKLRGQLVSLRDMESQLLDMQDQVDISEEKLKNIDKVVTRRLPSSATYSYLNEILAYSGVIKFNLNYTRSKETEKYGYHIYRVNGEGSFYRISNFLWYLERGPQIYKVKSFSLRSIESTDPETEKFQLLIPFEMEIWGFYAKVDDVPSAKRKLSHVKGLRAHNAFYPYVLRNLPPNVDNLLEVERSELKAVTQEKALVTDADGKVHTLALGDEVYLGFLNRLDPDAGEAEFSLNKGGVFERVVLQLKYENIQE